MNNYVFNIVIFMVTATTISIHYLIHPVLALSGNSWLMTITTIIYPIVDLTILFIITVMFYLIQSKKEKEYMLFCVTAFFCQVMTNLIFTYLSLKEAYHPGHSVDLLRILALFFIGMTAFYAKNSKSKLKMEVPNPLGNKDIIIPYTSIFVLLFLVIQSYQWKFNALSIGLLLAFLIVLARQFQILYKNKNLMSQFKHLAFHDPLTGLRNRRSFIQETEAILQNHQEDQVALLLIDLDRFKVVNDTLGHHVGDDILVKTAERLKEMVSTDALISRIGGNEFTIVLPNTSKKMCAALADKILEAFQQPLIMKDYEINITPSIGISIFPEHGVTSEELMKNADAAMYLSKENGKNAFSFYNTELNRAMVRKMQIETELKKAIQNEQLSLFYQPKVDLHTERIIGMEALLRWEHPDLGSISPVEFIPVAEETGQIVSIGEWVLLQACQQNKKWQEQGLPSLCVSVNVSVLHFQHGQFLETVQKAIKESQLDPKFLELEITESIMQNFKESNEILEGLRQLGIKTSVDDFGTGYSSLTVLQKLPIDTIKIDKSFVDELEKEGHNFMVKTIIDLSHNLELNVVAEGIETDRQMKILKDNGCMIGQGYLFSKPVAADELEVLLREEVSR
ncbi:EAL domain-containing protein [Psychrobacillus sp. PGGUH221]|uniref:putative bifunctional diguanylate cyclase/phosphodiesterase n=1 Tax=Psychrobacillus sp. PGGUH221 TaxID=3020058 RepID=UPI0035C6ABAF